MPKNSHRPNLLFILTDQQKASALGLYGNPMARTPALERMAAEGTLVEQTFCSSPICVPSRGTIVTGRYPHAHGLLYNDQRLLEHIPHLFGLLRAAGYRLALYGKNHCFNDHLLDSLFHEHFECTHVGYRPEPDDPILRSVNEWLRRPELLKAPWAAETAPFDPAVCPTAVITDRALRFLEQVEHSFCMWLSYPDPHVPLQAPEPYASLYPPQDVPLPPLGSEQGRLLRQVIARRMFAGDTVTEAQMRRCIGMYYGMQHFIDAQVGRVLDRLDALGLSEDTLVIYTSDHGDYMGEHYMIRKSLAFYDCLVQVPLLLRWPGQVPTGSRCRRLVSLADLLPTILDFLALEVPEGVEGRSVRLLLADGEVHDDDAVFAEGGLPGKPPGWEDLTEIPAGPLDGSFSPWGSRPEAWTGPAKMVRTPRYKLVQYESGEGELYDLVEDPWELHNCYGARHLADVQSWLQQRLLQWIMGYESRSALRVAGRGVASRYG